MFSLSFIRGQRGERNPLSGKPCDLDPLSGQEVRTGTGSRLSGTARKVRVTHQIEIVADTGTSRTDTQAGGFAPLSR